MRSFTFDNNNGYILYKNINDCLIKNDIIPLGFTPPVINGKLDKLFLEKIINSVDGVVLQGGDEINSFDLEIVKYLHDNDIPTLGICLGMQMMSQYFNGDLTRIKNHMHKDKYVHFVILKKGNKLFKIIGKRKILVNSRHKYAVIKTDLNKCAYSDVLEAVSDDNKKFFIGLQWHPESLDDINSYKLFKAFKKALKKKNN